MHVGGPDDDDDRARAIGLVLSRSETSSRRQTLYVHRADIGLSFPAIGEAWMGKLHQFGNVIIRVYGNDHLPPHFHVLTPDSEAVVDLATLRIAVGSLSARVEREALAWAAGNKAVIAAEWNRINPRFLIA